MPPARSRAAISSAKAVPREKETLVSRLIDRPIRPLFADGYKNDTQVIVTVMQHDLENDPDVVSMVAASAALTLSGVPFMGPIGGARVGYINGEYVLNPHLDEMAESKLDLVVAGTADAVLMVELEAQELPGRRDARRRHVRPPRLPAGHRRHHQAGRGGGQGAARSHRPPIFPTSRPEMLGLVEAELRAAYKNTDKQDRYAAVDAAKAKVKAHFVAGRRGEQPKWSAEQVAAVFKELQAKIVRWNILDTGSRIDGRDLKTVRPIVVGSRHPAAHARLGAVHARRDAGDRGRHARHRRGRAVCRRADRHVQGDLPAPLQLPALFGRRNRPHGFAGPPRDRPRQACLARHPPDAAQPRSSSPTRCASSPRSPSPTARPRWRRSAAPRWR